jgi:hypothetical protein
MTTLPLFSLGRIYNILPLPSQWLFYIRLWISDCGLKSKNGRLLQNSRPKEKSSFRASDALHHMVFRAKRDPESSPAIGGIQAILDSRFHGNAGTSNFCKRLIGNNIPKSAIELLLAGF